MRTADDILTLDDYNNIINKLKDYSSQLLLKENLSFKENGEFLFCEELNEIERTLTKISESIYLNYERKYFYNLSNFDYNIVNAWEIQLNNIAEKLEKLQKEGYKYQDYIENTYENLINKNYEKILYKEVE